MPLPGEQVWRWLGRLPDGPWVRGFVLCVCLGLFALFFTSLSRFPLVV
jgi:hypothetical protein